MLMALSLAPSLALVLWTGWQIRQYDLDAARQDVLLYAKSAAELQTRYTEATRRLLESLAVMEEVVEQNSATTHPILATLLQKYPEYLNLAAFRPDGSLFASALPLGDLNIADRKHFQEALAGKRLGVGEYQISQLAVTPTMLFACGARNATGEITAVVTAALDLSIFQSFLEETTLPERGVFGVVDHRGTRLFRHPDTQPGLVGTSIDAPFLSLLSGPQDSGTAMADSADGMTRLYGWTRLALAPGDPAYMAVYFGLEEDLALANSRSLTVRNVALLSATALASCAIAFFYGDHAIARRLLAVSHAAVRLGGGDLHARTCIPHGGDVIGHLAQAFDAMATRLQCQDARRGEVERDLRESEARFRHILDDVDSVAVQGYQMDGAVRFWNAASEKLYGYTEAEAQQSSLLDLIIPPAMREEVRDAIARMAETRRPIPSGELLLQRKDGSLTPVFSSHVLVDVPGKPLELYCIDVDLTPLKRVERELREARETAEAASRTKSEFLAAMSHDIRTPLNGLLGMLQLLRATPLGGEQTGYVQAAMEASRQLAALLEDILDLSRVESGKLHLRLAPFAMEDLAHATLDMFAPPARDKGLHLEVTLDPRLPPLLEVDATRLRQILFNLVSNAVKYTDQGQVQVEICPVSPAGLSPTRVLFAVNDTGVGMPPEALRSIFEPFSQGHAPRAAPRQGPGLGLAILRRLVHLMQGDIYMESAVGQGTLICVVLPLPIPPADMHPETSSMAESPPCPCTPGETGPLRLLLVEDDPVNRIFLDRALRQDGHVTHLAGTGVEALAFLRNHAVDMVLMDIQMPEMDGLEATRQVRASADLATPSDVPIIGVTAHAMLGDRERFLAAGMNDCLEKPLDLDVLRHTLTRWGGGKGA